MCITSIVFLIIKGIYKDIQLSKEGKYVKGRVTKVIKTPKMSRYAIRYSFNVNGKRYSSEVNVTFTKENKYREKYGKKGNSVKIIYLPSNPKINKVCFSQGC